MDISERLKQSEEWNSLKQQIGLDVAPCRFGELDIAYPSSEEEYCALGGYAVVMALAFSDEQEELPIERTYFKFRDNKIRPLIKLGVLWNDDDLLAEKIKETTDDKGRVYFENISFWAMPIHLLIDHGGMLAIDFKGERKDFVIMRGPWKTDRRVLEWMEKHRTGQVQIAENIPYDVIAKFIQREFISNNRIKL